MIRVMEAPAYVAQASLHTVGAAFRRRFQPARTFRRNLLRNRRSRQQSKSSARPGAGSCFDGQQIKLNPAC